MVFCGWCRAAAGRQPTGVTLAPTRAVRNSSTSPTAPQARLTCCKPSLAYFCPVNQQSWTQ
jgi:hypothetical protein